MSKAKLKRLELKNPRYADRDLREHLSEFILYAKYAGIDLREFHKSISGAILAPGNEGPEMGYGGKLVLESDEKTIGKITRLIELYPVFSAWDVKFLEVKRSKPSIKTKPKEEKKMAAKKSAAKKPAKKAAAKKKVAKKKGKK
ncbi:MAG: hypothetical protein OEV92_06495 [Nitrospinota bacterium]|nr:hypothetical protein [Nitrospinota bacterium]